MFSKKIYFSFYLLIILSLVSFATLFLFKIESSDNISILVSKDKKSLLVDSNVVYKLKNYKKVIVRVNDNYNQVHLGKTLWNEEKNMFEIQITKVSSYLIPNTTLDAKIIYDSKPVFKVIFGIV